MVCYHRDTPRFQCSSVLSVLLPMPPHRLNSAAQTERSSHTPQWVGRWRVRVRWSGATRQSSISSRCCYSRSDVLPTHFVRVRLESIRFQSLILNKREWNFECVWVKVKFVERRRGNYQVLLKMENGRHSIPLRSARLARVQTHWLPSNHNPFALKWIALHFHCLNRFLIWVSIQSNVKTLIWNATEEDLPM